MPTSDPWAMGYIAQKLFEIQPKTVLDIGIGCGKYGFLTREYSDRDYCCGLSPKKVILHGVEIYEKYITNIQRAIYDEIFIGNALDLLPSLVDNYEVIIMGDVIEHFKKEDGIKMIDLIQKKSNNFFIVTPNGYSPQGAFHDNIYETHLSGWTFEELSNYGNASFFGNLLLLER